MSSPDTTGGVGGGRPMGLTPATSSRGPASAHRRFKSTSGSTEDVCMPKMSDGRRKKIQAKQRKLANATKRAAKVAKRKRNS